MMITANSKDFLNNPSIIGKKFTYTNKKNGRAIRAVFFDLVMTGLAEQAEGRAQQLSKILSKLQAIFTSIGIVESVWSFPYIIIFYVISEQLTTLRLLKVGRAKS